MRPDTSRHITMDFTDLADRVLEPYPTRYVLRLFVADVYRLAAACLIARGLIRPEDTSSGRLSGRLSGRFTRKTAPDDPAMELISPLFERAKDGSFYRLQSVLFGRHRDLPGAGEPQQQMLQRVREWVEMQIDRRFPPRRLARRNQMYASRLHAPQDELAGSS